MIMENRLFFEWLAGLLDGAGRFAIDKGKCTVSITRYSLDLKMLKYIKRILGVGKIYPRPDIDSNTFEISEKLDILYLLNNINGLIYNSVTFKSFSLMCIPFGIIPIQASIPSILSPYYAGFFDADGCIWCCKDKGSYKLSVSVCNKFEVDILPFKTTFGGNVTVGKRSFVWCASNKANVLAFSEYYKSVGHYKSFKGTKFLLIDKYYELKDLRAYRPDSIYHARWVKHYAKWGIKGYND